MGQVRSEGSGLFLKLPLKQIRSSVISLTVDASSLRYIVNTGKGTIVRKHLCSFSGQNCGSFEAIASAGYLHVIIRNDAAIDAAFIVSVRNCSVAMLPVASQRASIKAQETTEFVFELQAGTDIGANCTCQIFLENADGDELDSTTISFTLNSTTYGPTPEQSDLGNNVRLRAPRSRRGKETETHGIASVMLPFLSLQVDSPNGARTFAVCSRLCPNILNLKCSFDYGCWKRLFQGLSVLGIVLISTYVLWMIGKMLLTKFRYHRKRSYPYPILHDLPSGATSSQGPPYKKWDNPLARLPLPASSDYHGTIGEGSHP